MTITDLLDKHFPKEELTAGELYEKFSTVDYFDAHLCVGNGRRFTSMSWRGHKTLYSTIELYTGNSDSPQARVSEYTMVSVYDLSDPDKMRAFLREYIDTLDVDALRWEIREVVDCA